MPVKTKSENLWPYAILPALCVIATCVLIFRLMTGPLPARETGPEARPASVIAGPPQDQVGQGAGNAESAPGRAGPVAAAPPAAFVPAGPPATARTIAPSAASRPAGPPSPSHRGGGGHRATPAKPQDPDRSDSADLVIDSNMTRAQALGNNHFPRAILDRMALVTVYYHGFDGRRHRGQIVVNKDVAEDTKEIFAELEQIGYPITKVVPIVKYGWSDQASINDNNTSAFNYRIAIVPGVRSTKLSNHSFGRAIDLNPLINPFVSSSGASARAYDPDVEGTLTLTTPATQIFLEHGWSWGGQWKGGKDYQHFEKVSSGKETTNP